MNAIKNSFLIIILLSISLLIAGCGRWVAANPKTVLNLPDYEKKYSLQQRNSAFVGQQILYVDIFETDAEIGYDAQATPLCDIRIDARDKWRNHHLKMAQGTAYRIGNVITIGETTFYALSVTDQEKNEWGVLTDESGTLYQHAIYNPSYQMVLYPGKVDIKPCNFKILHGPTIYKKIRSTKLYSLELIYSGKNDVSMNLLYREYYRDRARQAFTQHLTYQADAKQIRFRDFVIQIHQATNEQITYTILEDGLKSVFD